MLIDLAFLLLQDSQDINSLRFLYFYIKPLFYHTIFKGKEQHILPHQQFHNCKPNHRQI